MKKDPDAAKEKANPAEAQPEEAEPAAEMEEASEERSGDQPVVEDDATTAPIPEKVRRLANSSLSSHRVDLFPRPSQPLPGRLALALTATRATAAHPHRNCILPSCH
jgi:hypothetical protein